MVHYGLQVKPCLQGSFKFPKFQASLFQRKPDLDFLSIPLWKSFFFSPQGLKKLCCLTLTKMAFLWYVLTTGRVSLTAHFDSAYLLLLNNNNKKASSKLPSPVDSLMWRTEESQFCTVLLQGWPPHGSQSSPTQLSRQAVLGDWQWSWCWCRGCWAIHSPGCRKECTWSQFQTPLRPGTSSDLFYRRGTACECLLGYT